MDSASPKRKPGSGLTHGACYVWLQRPAPLGFSVPVNAAPFISLRFHGKVQSAQQVAVSPGGEGSARGPSRSHSTLGAEACSRVPAAVGGRPLTAPRPLCRQLPLSRPPPFRLTGHQLHLAPSPAPARLLPLLSSLAPDFPPPLLRLPGPLHFPTTSHSIWGRQESSGSPPGWSQPRAVSHREPPPARARCSQEGPAAAFTANAKPKDSRPAVSAQVGKMPSLEEMDLLLAGSKFLSNFQVSSFHQELIELAP